MTLKNNRAPLLCHFRLCASFRSHQSFQTGVTVRKRPTWVKISDFWSRVTSKFDGWPWKTIGHLFNATSSFVHHFTTISEFKLKLQSGNAKFGSKPVIFGPAWPWNLTDDLEKQQGTSSMLFQALYVISQLSVNWNSSYSPETPNLGKNWRFLVPRDLEIWRITFKNNRAPLLSTIKLCVSFHCHMWIQTGVTARKRLSVVMTSETLTFDLWPWPFAWTSRLLMVITPENFRMIRWQEHCQKGVTGGRTDGRTDRRKELFLELLGRS